MVYVKITDHNTKLPENNFDTTYQIPNTNIIFKYPSAGFYGLGIDIASSTEVRGLISGIHTESISEFERNAQSAYAVLNINLIENEKNFKNINDFAEDFKKDPGVSFYDQEYAKENGRLININDKEYFIYKLTEDATAWSAFTVNKDGIVWVMLAYTSSFTPYSVAVYKNNDGLFLEILENISFEEIPVFADDEPETVVNSLLQTLNDSSLDVKFSDPVKSSQWWISDDDWNIIDPNAVLIASSNLFSPTDPQIPFTPAIEELNNLVSKMFLDNGFTLNVKNTSPSKENNPFYDYVLAFQKGETRCTLTINGDFGNQTIACSNRFQEAYNEQIPYLKALNNRNVTVHVHERIGDFVWLDVNLRRTGSAALMRDDGKEIKFIVMMQEAPSCDLMLENQVPKEVYDVCYDKFGNLIR